MSIETLARQFQAAIDRYGKKFREDDVNRDERGRFADDPNAEEVVIIPDDEAESEKPAPKDRESAFGEAFREIERKQGHGLVMIHDLRQAMPDLSREEFDDLVWNLRKSGKFTADSSDSSRGKLTPEQKEAGIMEGDSRLVYLSRYSLRALVQAAVERYGRKTKPAAGQKELQWITIGGDAVDGKKHVGGTPVQIDGQGNIHKGPAALEGQKVGEIGKKGTGKAAGGKEEPKAEPEQEKKPPAAEDQPTGYNVSVGGTPLKNGDWLMYKPTKTPFKVANAFKDRRNKDIATINPSYETFGSHGRVPNEIHLGEVERTSEPGKEKPAPAAEKPKAAADSDPGGFALAREKDKIRKKAEFDDTGKGKQGGLFGLGKGEIKGQGLMFDDHFDPKAALEDSRKEKGKSTLDLPEKPGEEKPKEKQTAPQFENYQDALKWIDERAGDYKNKNEFLASDEYKTAYPAIQVAHQSERSDYAQAGQKAMKSAGMSEGDTVSYDWVSPWGQVENYEGVLTLRNGVPYVKLTKGQTISGKKSIIWHKGWKKPSEKSRNSRLTSDFQAAIDRYAASNKSCNWITLKTKSKSGDSKGGAKVCIGDNGKITKGPAALKGKKLSSISGPKNAVDDSIRTGAKRFGVRKDDLKAAVDEVMAERMQVAKEQQELKRIAHKRAGIYPSDVEKLINRNLDWTSVNGFDKAAQELPMLDPRFNWPEDEAPERLWEFLREDAVVLPKKTDDDIVAEAGERLRASGTTRGKKREPVPAEDEDEDYVPFSRFRQDFERELYRRGVVELPLVERFNRAMEPYRLAKKPAKGQGEFKWITVGGHSEGDAKHAGGTPVKIDGSGNIVAGPDALADKGIKNLKDFGKSSQSADNSHLQSADNKDNGAESKADGAEPKAETKAESGKMKTKIESSDRLSNSGLHRSGGLGSPHSRWSLKNEKGEFINLYEITKNNDALRGDRYLEIEAELPEGRYILSTGKGSDRIEQEIVVGTAAASKSDRIADVSKRLPKLDGSSKQVEWANKIRKEWVADWIDDAEEVEALLSLTSASNIIDARDSFPSKAL